MSLFHLPSHQEERETVKNILLIFFPLSTGQFFIDTFFFLQDSRNFTGEWFQPSLPWQADNGRNIDRPDSYKALKPKECLSRFVKRQGVACYMACHKGLHKMCQASVLRGSEKPQLHVQSNTSVAPLLWFSLHVFRVFSVKTYKW